MGKHNGQRITEVSLMAVGNMRMTPLIFHDVYGDNNVLIHNHPSGNMNPSDCDVMLATIFKAPNFIINNLVTLARAIVPLGLYHNSIDYFWSHEG